MAERIVRQLIDDIDGTDIADGSGARIEFSIRGTNYQIDLSDANIAKFDKALKPYVEAAAKVRGSKASTPKSNARAGGGSSKEQLAAIREWAGKNGYEVAARGRIKAEIVEAFESAH